MISQEWNISDSVSAKQESSFTHIFVFLMLSVIMRTALNTLKINDFPFHWIEKCCSLPNSGEMKEHARMHWISCPCDLVMIYDKWLTKMDSQHPYIFTKKKKSRFLHKRSLRLLTYKKRIKFIESFQMYNKETRTRCQWTPHKIIHVYYTYGYIFTK